MNKATVVKQVKREVTHQSVRLMQLFLHHYKTIRVAKKAEK